jgi:hypothetical protein
MGQVKAAYQEDMDNRFNGTTAEDIARWARASSPESYAMSALRQTKIFLLMDCSQVVSAYIDETLAHHDCLTCQDGAAYEDMPDHHDYWVKPMDMVVD